MSRKDDEVIPQKLSPAGEYALYSIQNAPTLSEESRETYSYDFLKLVRELGGDPLTWTNEDLRIQIFRNARRTNVKKKAVVKRVGAALSTLHPEWEQWSVVDEKIEGTSTNSTPLNPLTEQQIVGLTTVAAHNERNLAYVTLGYKTGMPISSILDLNWKNIAISTSDVVINFPQVVPHELDGEASEVMLNYYIRQRDRNLADDEMPVFLRDGAKAAHEQRERLKRARLNQLLAEYGKTEEVSRPDLSPRTLQATAIYYNGWNASAIIRNLGLSLYAAENWVKRCKGYKITLKV